MRAARRSGFGVLTVFVFLATATALFTALYATTLFFETVNFYWLPHAVFTGAVVSLLSALGVGLLGRRRPYVAVMIFLVLVAVALVVLRAIYPYYPGWAGFLNFAIGEMLLFCALGGQYGVLDTFITSREREAAIFWLGVAAMIGGVVGALGGYLTLVGLSTINALMISAFSLIVQLGLVIALSIVRPVRAARQVVYRHYRFAKVLRRRLSIIALGLVTGIFVFLLRAELHVLALTIYTAIPAEQLLLFLTALFTGAAAVALVGYLLARLILRFAGNQVANLFYPVALLIPIILWWLNPGALWPVVITSLVYLGLLPGAYLTVTRYNNGVIPRRFGREAMLLTNGIAGATGMALGSGFLILFFPVISEGALISIALVIAVALFVLGAAMGPIYRSNWLDHIRRRSWQAGKRGGAYRPLESTDAQIRDLLASDDEFEREFGLLASATHKEPVVFLDDVVPVVAKGGGADLRRRIRDYLDRLEVEQLEPLLTSPLEVVRARTVAAMVWNRKPLPIHILSSLLHDDATWVRVLACILAWFSGLEGMAEVAWASTSLAEVGEQALVELLEVVQRGAPAEVLTVLKRLAWYPSPGVRTKAMQVLGYVLRDKGYDDAELYETALKGIAHERADVRASAVRLLVASGADEAPAKIGALLFDDQAVVRDAAAIGLADLGASGVQPAREAVAARHSEGTTIAGLAALGGSGRRGQARLYSYVAYMCEWLHKNMYLYTSIRGRGGAWAPLEMVLADYYRRVSRRVGLMLQTMGYPDAAVGLHELVENDDRWREASLADTVRRSGPPRFVQPILEAILSQHKVLRSRKGLVAQDELEGVKVVMTATDPWLRVGALFTWHLLGNEAIELKEESHPKVLAAIAQISHRGAQEIIPMDRLLFLKQITFFQGLTLDELLQLDGVLIEEEFEAGQTIFEEGTVGDRFYIIYKGEVELRVATRPEPIATFGKGDHFAEMSLFDEAPRSASAIAKTGCYLLSLDRRRFETLVLDKPQILYELSKELSRRLRKATQQST